LIGSVLLSDSGPMIGRHSVGWTGQSAERAVFSVRGLKPFAASLIKTLQGAGLII
jgi:hypothetical protein